MLEGKNMEYPNNQNRVNFEKAMNNKSDVERWCENNAKIQQKYEELRALKEGGHKSDAKQVEKEIEELEKKNAELAKKLDAQRCDEYGVPITSQKSEQQQMHNTHTRNR